MKYTRTHLSWENREKDLRKLERYGRFSVMFYRTNDFIHSKRVGALLESLIPLAKKMYRDFDARLARQIAEYHDDYELQQFLGDVPLQLKLMMDERELSSLAQKEELAAEAMAQMYPRKVGRYNYLELLLHAIHKDCMEAQLVSVADKVDGYCEALHEVLAGNIVFLDPVINYNMQIFNNFPNKYPLIKNIFLEKHNLLSNPVVNLVEYFALGGRIAELHTLETLVRDTGMPRYEEWKKTTIRIFGVDALIRQTEFTPI
jgi:5'-deoxynucleotidase YfbR-like HD superfamily hydrolase